MYEGFNGGLPASRMHARGKGSDRKANAARSFRFAEMRSLFAEQRPISIGSLPTTGTPIVPQLRKKHLPFPEYARFRFLDDRYLRKSFGRKRETFSVSPRKQNDERERERKRLHKEKREAVMDT